MDQLVMSKAQPTMVFIKDKAREMIKARELITSILF
jgi:hypothetical protein